MKIADQLLRDLLVALMSRDREQIYPAMEKLNDYLTQSDSEIPDVSGVVNGLHDAGMGRHFSSWDARQFAKAQRRGDGR
jgi:hypothetical protein